jgi:hypothetical protein
LIRFKKRRNSTGAVPFGQVGYDLTRGDVEGRIEVGGAVALVVMRASFGQSGTQRQDRGGPIESLDLGLFVHAEYQGAFGRIDVEPHDVADLFDELGVRAELEGVDEVRLEPEGPPDLPDRRR